MLCYKDRTYCDANCANNSCDMRATQSIFEAANKIGLPVSLSDFSYNCVDLIPVASKDGGDDA